MKLKAILPGILFIIMGVGVFVYYDLHIKPDEKARELMIEGDIISERADKDALNQAISIYSRIVAKYPKSKLVSEANYNIGRCYQKLGLYRLANLKYAYVLKNNYKNMSEEVKSKLFFHMAKIKARSRYSEEAINQLYDLLNSGYYDSDFRSRVYSELGHNYLKHGKLSDARRMFDLSLTERGSNEDAIIGKARSLMRLGIEGEAFDLYEHFLKYYGSISQYTKDVKRAYKEQAYRSGLSHFRKGRYYKAINNFSRVVKNFSYDKFSENALYWMGESYYAVRSYDRAINYFDRVLTNGFHHKDQDARIKKGYAYFSVKKFDLAAREFQIYLRHYPRGTHANIAKNWKEMSTKELLYRIKTKRTPKPLPKKPPEEPAQPPKEEIKDEAPEEEEELEDEDDELEEEFEEEDDFSDELGEEDEWEDEGDDEFSDNLEEELDDAGELGPGEDEEIFGNKFKDLYGKKIELENVAEL